MKKGRIIASVLALALTVTSVCVQTGEADAAKKVSLKKTANVTVGKTIKLKLKNGSKKAKVTWKSAKSKIAKVTKKTTKGNAATKIKGVKKGKAKITATYKLGKKKAKKYTCTVTVKKKDSNIPVASATPVQSAGPVVSSTPIVTSQPTDGPGPQQTPTPDRTSKPTATPTPKPTTKPTPSPDIQIYKSYKDIVVDGDIDVAWDFAPKHEIKNWKADAEGKTAQTSDAYAKILWTSDNVYIMVEATDPEIDCGNEATYYQDSIELFVDEYDNKEEWGSAKARNEFQYRTILKDTLGADEKRGSLTDKTQWDGEEISTAFKKTDKGYVVEFAVPLHEPPVEKGFIGIEVQINDAKGGERNGTWNLFADPANGGAIPYDSTLVFGDCQYAIKREPKEITLNFSDPDSTNMELPDQFATQDEDGNYLYYDENDNVVCTKTIDPDTFEVTYKDASGNVIDKPIGNKKPSENNATMNTEARYDSENKLVYCKTANNIVIYFPEDRRILLGEEAKITIEGTYTADEGAEMSDGDTVFRTWLVDTEDKKLTGDGPVTVSNQVHITYEDIKSEDGKFSYVGDLTASGPDKPAGDGYESDGTADAIMIKAPSYNSTIGNLVISNVVLTVFEPVEYVEPSPSPTPGEDPDDPNEPVKQLDLSQVHFASDGIGSYDAEKGIIINDTREGDGTTEMYIPLPITVSPGQKLSVTISGSKWGTGDFRIWTTPEGKETSGDFVENNGIYLQPAVEADGSFTGTVELVAKDEDCTRITLKPAHGTKIQGLTISDIKVSIVEPEEPDEPDDPNPASDIDVVLSPATAHLNEGKPGWYVDSSNNEYNEEEGSVSFDLPRAGNSGIGFYFNEDKSGVDVSKYEKAIITLVCPDTVPLRAIVSDSDKLEYDNHIIVEKFDTVGAEEKTIELDLKSKNGTGFGVAISHVGWDGNYNVANPKITVKSIKLVAKK